MKYELLNGETLDLSALGKEDDAFLLDLMQRAMNDEDYFDLEHRVCGQGAYTLKGSARVTREVHESVLVCWLHERHDAWPPLRKG